MASCVEALRWNSFKGPSNLRKSSSESTARVHSVSATTVAARRLRLNMCQTLVSICIGLERLYQANKAFKVGYIQVYTKGYT